MGDQFNSSTCRGGLGASTQPAASMSAEVLRMNVGQMCSSRIMAPFCRLAPAPRATSCECSSRDLRLGNIVKRNKATYSEQPSLRLQTSSQWSYRFYVASLAVQ